MQIKELRWVDDFFKKVRSHIFLREEDKVLILPPNKVYKVNETGHRVLRHLLSGKKIGHFPGLTDGERARQVHDFFCDLHSFYLGCSVDPDIRSSSERCRYDFSFTSLPILGELAVTYRCNNSCLFCYAHNTVAGGVDKIGRNLTPGTGNETQDAPGSAAPAQAPVNTGANTGTVYETCRELSLAEAKQIILIFKKDAQIPFFSFTGGEPLLRDDLEQMMAFAVKQGLQINLITNGTLLTPRRARSLYKSGLRTAQVSLESQHEELHDYLTDTPGSFIKTLQGIKILREAGIAVQTNSTLNSRNAGTLHDLPDFLKQQGIMRFSVNLFIPVGRGLANEQLFLPYTATAGIIDKLRVKAVTCGQTFFWYSPVPYCHYNPVARGLGNKSCAAMDGLLSVSPAGDVLPCSSFPRPMGNLLKENFRTIWLSEKAMFFKHKHFAPVECAGCEKFTACQSACPLYWMYAGTDELKKSGTAANGLSACTVAGPGPVNRGKKNDNNKTIKG